MSEDKQDLTGNIVTENNNGDNSLEKKARNRMVAEGYKYKLISDNGEPDILEPIEDGNHKSERQRWLKVKVLFLVAVLVIACQTVIIVFQHIYRDTDNKVCTTSECVQGAAYILNKMDRSVDPCQDFYTYSCGNWVKNVQIPPSKSKYGSFAMISDDIMVKMKEIMSSKEELYKGVNSSAVHKAYQLYSMCIDEEKIKEDGVKPALKMIGDTGGWTMTSDGVSGVYDPDVWTIQDAVLLAHRMDLGPLFSMGVSTDERNSSGYRIKFEQNGLTLSTAKEYFSNHTNYEKLKTAFAGFGSELLKLLGSTGVDQKITEIYEFEQNMAKIFVPREQLIDREKIYHNMSLQQFQDNYLGDWLNLEQYMKGMFADIVEVPMTTEVVVYTPEYFTKLQDLVENTDNEILANYIVWHAVVSMIGYMSDDFLTAALILDTQESGVKEYPPRWKRCLGKTQSSFGFATSALYVEKYFTESSKKEVEFLFEGIRTSFISNLDSLVWMDDATRSYAKVKAQAVNKMLGYPDYIIDPKKLDKHYENRTLVPGQWFESKLGLMANARRKNLRHLGTVPRRNEWDMFPTEVNGYYSADFNHVVFTAGILSPPLFNPTSTKSFNFGSFGMICGHELTHGFDNKGRIFDKDGNMRNWWTESSSKNFDKHSQCFIDFYSNYTINETPLNGKTTLSENIADNGGMRMGYLAFKAWQKKNSLQDSVTFPGMDFTPDQLFFLGMSQVWCSHYTPQYIQQAINNDDHSIAKFRVLGSMSNSQDFANAFNCAKGSKMNPTNKCTVW